MATVEMEAKTPRLEKENQQIPPLAIKSFNDSFKDAEPKVPLICPGGAESILPPFEIHHPLLEHIPPVQGPQLDKDNSSVGDIKSEGLLQLHPPTKNEKGEGRKSNQLVLSTDVSSIDATPLPKDVMEVVSDLIDATESNDKDHGRKLEIPKLQLSAKCFSATEVRMCI